jgi:hypothetical protein
MFMSVFAPKPVKTIINKVVGPETTPDPNNAYTVQVVGSLYTDEYVGETFPESVARRTDTRIVHEPTITAGRGTLSPGQGPTISVNGTLLTLAFTPNDTGDRAYRMFKIPSSYVTGSAFHIHWTKGVNTNQSGSHVRWKVDYTVFDGSTEVANGIEYTFQVEDSYEDSGTTTRVVHRTSDIPLSGFVAGWYVSCFVEAVSPVASPALSGDVHLFSVDMTYVATINSGTI